LKLIVGPAGSRNDLTSAAKDSWTAFVSEIGTLPFECDPITFDSNARSHYGIAATFVYTGPLYRTTEFALILLSPAFFEKSENQQFLTLLHESIHLRFMLGPLRERVIESLDLYRRLETPDDVTDDTQRLFLNQRLAIAFQFRNFIDEIVAELFLRKTYPAYLRRRIEHYAEMRRATLSLWKKALPTLQRHEISHEILRNELGVRLAKGEQEADELRLMSATLDEELQRQCSSDEYARHLILKDEVMSITLEPLSFDGSAFDHAFRTVIEIPRGQPEAT
jgi:hypothetical protein